jgi:alpha-tubulin suppressor-like RCC1 family protein
MCLIWQQRIDELSFRPRNLQRQGLYIVHACLTLEKETFNNKEGRLYFFSYVADVELMAEPSSYESHNFGVTLLDVMGLMADESKSSLMYLNCGDTHFSATSSKGTIYQWGKTDLGQLGFFAPDRIRLTSITFGIDDFLPSISRIQQGFNHTAAYSLDKNRLLVWGDNSKGQHGIGNFSNVNLVSDLTHLIKDGTSVSMLECKGNCTGLVLSDGTGYIWPHMGKGGSVSSTPMYAAFGKLKILSISLGLDFSVFLISDGTVYSMGSSNKYGELGLGDTRPRFTPVKIKSLFESGN